MVAYERDFLKRVLDETEYSGLEWHYPSDKFLKLLDLYADDVSFICKAPIDNMDAYYVFMQGDGFYIFANFLEVQKFSVSDENYTDLLTELYASINRCLCYTHHLSNKIMNKQRSL